MDIRELEELKAWLEDRNIVYEGQNFNFFGAWAFYNHYLPKFREWKKKQSVN